jgi:hypothetical protein
MARIDGNRSQSVARAVEAWTRGSGSSGGSALGRAVDKNCHKKSSLAMMIPGTRAPRGKALLTINRTGMADCYRKQERSMKRKCISSKGVMNFHEKVTIVS